MPVKAMSKSMILHDSHIFLDISFVCSRSLEVGPIKTHPNGRPTWTMSTGSKLQRGGQSFGGLSSHSTTPCEWSHLPLTGSTTAFRSFFFWDGWMFFFGDVAVTLSKTNKWLHEVFFGWIFFFGGCWDSPGKRRNDYTLVFFGWMFFCWRMLTHSRKRRND